MSRLILIGGGSSSGKTYITQNIINKVGADKITYITLDDYYKDQTEMSMNFVFQVDDFSLAYGEKEVLHHITLNIAEHAVTAFIGPSGCGKSSLLRAFNRLNDLIPDAKETGRILYHDKPLEAANPLELRSQVGMAKEDAENLFGNLIENACKYNKDGGSLSLELTPAYFRIKDTGVGIAEKDQSRIYERFYRVDPAKSKALGGTGLGLSIVKHIALDYHFQLHLESTLGLGSTFTIFFAPLKPQ